MKLTTTARHFETTPELITYTETKLRRLKRYFDNILHVDVKMSVEKFRHIAEVSVHVNGHDFAAQEESEDMYTSIDNAAKDLERQIKKFKGKILDSHKHRRPKSIAEEKVIGSQSVGREAGFEIVERLERDIHDLAVEEAIVEMEDGELDFLLFNNRETGKLNLVYKRSDNNYGLIDEF